MASVPPPKEKYRGQDLALHNAARNDYVSKIEQLVEAGMDIDEQDGNRVTPLIFASSLGNLAAVKALVRLGAARTLKDSLGYTAFQTAMFHGDFRGVTVAPFDEIMALTKTDS